MVIELMRIDSEEGDIELRSVDAPFFIEAQRGLKTRVVWESPAAPSLIEVEKEKKDHVPFGFPYGSFAYGTNMAKRTSVQLSSHPHTVLGPGFGRHIIQFVDNNRLEKRSGYGAHRVRMIFRKGTGLSITKKGKVYKEPWKRVRSDKTAPVYSDKEWTVRGLCDIGEATTDAAISEMGNELGGRFGVPLRISTFKKLPLIQRTKRGFETILRSVRRLQSMPLRDDTGKPLRLANGDTFNHLPRNPDFPLHDDAHSTFKEAVCYDFGTSYGVRLNFVHSVEGHKEREKLFLAQLAIARAIASEEDSAIDSLPTFLNWLYERQAENLAILHHMRYCSPEMGCRNMTLGGEMLDKSACYRVFGDDAEQKLLSEVGSEPARERKSPSLVSELARFSIDVLAATYSDDYQDETEAERLEEALIAGNEKLQRVVVSAYWRKRQQLDQTLSGISYEDHKRAVDAQEH